MADSAFLAAFADLPVGTFSGRSGGRDYIVTRTVFADGRSEKLVAEARDGSDYISLNLYRLAGGPVVKPCEMPLDKVTRFVSDLRPEGSASPS